MPILAKDRPILTMMLQAVVEPHSRLAARLFRLVRNRSTDDPTHEYQTAGVIVFMAGVDKALSLALECLYLAGQVEWGWMRGRRRAEDILPGEIVCSPGFGAKLYRLRDLGCDLTDVSWLAEMRNTYVHACTIRGGYAVSPRPSRPVRRRLSLRPQRLTVQASGPFLLALGPRDIGKMTKELVERLGRLLEEKGCAEAWRATEKRAGSLPVDPQPWTHRINAPRITIDGMYELVRELNAEMIGEGCEKLLAPSARRTSDQ